ncbi:MAG: hypothetical protein JXA42_08610 [Anaerolineales bacterium]|nr:hypothetical protein [Anaerolineales bacterium]
MVDQLADEYAGQLVVFLEQDIDNTVGGRYQTWWDAHEEGGSTMLPMVMVDSGHQISNGYEDFYSVYKAMVDAELARPPKAEIVAYHERTGDTLTIHGQLTNLSGVDLSEYDYHGTLQALIFEETHIGCTGRFVHAAPLLWIEDGLFHGETMTFSLSETLEGANESRWRRFNITTGIYADRIEI